MSLEYNIKCVFCNNKECLMKCQNAINFFQHNKQQNIKRKLSGLTNKIAKLYTENNTNEHQFILHCSPKSEGNFFRCSICGIEKNVNETIKKRGCLKND